MKFLIDECLSLELADIACNAGFAESAHVSRRGMRSWLDWQIMDTILKEDWTFVTRNADDFRPRPGSKSKMPCYLGQELHAGLICLNPPAGSTAREMSQYFKAALHVLKGDPDLVNQVLEVWPEADGKVRIDRYDFPDEA